MRDYDVTVVPTGAPLLPGDVLFAGGRGTRNLVGFLVRMGTWSRYQHVGVVLGQHKGRLITVEAFGDGRGTAVRSRPGRQLIGPVLRITRPGDAWVGHGIAERAVHMAGASGRAYLDGNVAGALTTPGVPYGWLSIARISARALSRVPLLGLLGRGLGRLLDRRPDTGAHICSEHVRTAIEGAVAAPMSTELLVHETSPQDLLSLLLDDGYIG